jgi:ribosome biogenesis protein BMS1
VKRHRWHKRVLKSNDPLIFSIGWRRFQSMPVYTMEDANDRLRYLKYTPEHMHCVCSFYGPLVPPNTGILAFQTTSSKTTNFRISLTGTALELQASTGVVKKLKLVGHPTIVFKNTAFIEGMFTSALEVSTFIGAKIKTVSGIRGSIKRALKDGKPGSFRAAFEDKPLMSDIVICRLWVPVEIKKLYNPVHTLLDKNWQGVRTVAQIRREEQIAQTVNKDSLYKPIERQPRVFNKLNIPKKLQATLPFASKPKQQESVNRKSYLARRAVMMEPEERKERAAVQMLQTISKDKRAKKHTANLERKQKSDKAAAKKAEIFSADAKLEKKRKYTAQGKEEARKKEKV